MTGNTCLSSFRRHTVLFILFSLLFAVSHAANVTVDDANPLWQYSAAAANSTGWGVITPNHPCTFCMSQPDSREVYNGTWHDTDQANTATIQFTGIAITVYGICPAPLSDGSVYVTNYSFTLDGTDEGMHSGPGCDTYVYDWVLYSKTGLSPGTHTFTIANAPPPMMGLSGRSDLLLDYAVFDDGGLSQSTASSTAPASSRTAASGSAASASSTPSSSSASGERPPLALVGVVLSTFVALLGARIVL